LFKSRFLAGFILVLIGFSLVLIALISWFLARNNQQQRQRSRKKSPEKTSAEKPLLPPVQETIIVSNEPNGAIPTSPASIEQTNKPSTAVAAATSSSSSSPLPPATVRMSHSSTVEKKSTTPPLPSMRRTVPQGTFTRESSIATDEDDEDGLNTFLRTYQALPPVPTKIDEEYEDRFSMSMNASEELGLGSLINDPVLSSGRDDFVRTGLIKPLNLHSEPPQRYTKYVSSYSKFVLPRPVKSSPLSEYQQR
jgi:hypothetical protein